MGQLASELHMGFNTSLSKPSRVAQELTRSLDRSTAKDVLEFILILGRFAPALNSLQPKI